jgi:hypothetical protein
MRVTYNHDMSRPYVDPAVRIASAADEVLPERGYVGMVDALMAVRGVGSHEVRTVHAGFPTVGRAARLAARRSAAARCLRQFRAEIADRKPDSGVGQAVPLAFHFVSPDMPEKKLEKLREKVGIPPGAATPA